LDLVQLGDNLAVHTLSTLELGGLRDHARTSGIDIELGMVGVEAEPLIKYLDLALFLGARLIRLLPRTLQGQPDLATAKKSIRSLLDRYRSAGIVLALENYEQDTSAQLISLVKQIDDPCVGICFDTANSLGALETPQQLSEVLAPYVRNIHIKDFTFRRVPSVMGCRGGAGLTLKALQRRMIFGVIVRQKLEGNRPA
jgi:sugar phosphate isomerase/epimerase